MEVFICACELCICFVYRARSLGGGLIHKWSCNMCWWTCISLDTDLYFIFSLAVELLQLILNRVFLFDIVLVTNVCMPLQFAVLSAQVKCTLSDTDVGAVLPGMLTVLWKLLPIPVTILWQEVLPIPLPILLWQYFLLFITFGNVHVFLRSLIERLLSRNGRITLVYNDTMLMSKYCSNI